METSECIHGNTVWFGHECGLCEAGGDPTVNFTLPHLWVQSACSCKTARMENPDCEVHGGDDD